MRPFLFAAGAAVFCGFAGPAAQAQSDEDCALMGELATTIMRGRQSGVPLTEMMRAGTQSDNPVANDLTRKMILAAYDLPRYSSDGMQARAVTDFANDVVLICYQAAD